MKVIIICFLLVILSIGVLEASSPWTGKDKTMHLLGSAYLVYWNYHLSSEVFDNSHHSSLMFSVSLTSLMGTSKEMSDKYYKRTRFSWYDMAYNAAGIALGVVIITAVN